MGMPIRILHIVVNMNRGGAENLIMNLYRKMDRSKIQFDFLTCKSGVFDSEINQLGGKIHRIPYISEIGHFKYSKRLREFFAENKEYWIVHSHLDKMSGLVLRAAEKAKIPIRIAHSHNTMSEGGALTKCYKWLMGCYVHHNSSHRLACSEKASKWLFGKTESMILKNGIDGQKYRFSHQNRNRIRKELDIGEDTFVVGHVGRFCHQKNHVFIINIFREIVKLKANSILLLAGGGPLQDAIEKKVNRLNLGGKVKFLGIRGDVNDLLHAFDLLLFPSHHEGLPLALVEAQASGLPCLISDVISNEVDLGAGLIQYERLTTPPKEWAVHALAMKKRLSDINDLIKLKGYDINLSAGWLESFYLQIHPWKEQ
ncbi:glycosyltransferase family 1 protein [Falsibacillus albus]|uniref:Glycosyltransferase family 1 protein n=1 Tax=Falsibacillus albus TaxID=2478915 RepID=A0A3L7K6F4_9BACI|nr:glycosyltransferase family 1 protein [Falsibacillus albus]RLQ96282.1 glycosyltransferase family 1 protein [Falsibacillus albus]